MNRDLYIHTLQGMRDVFTHEHMDTQVESLDVAIWAIETQEQLQKERDAALAMARMEMFVDGTLSITVDMDISKIDRVLVSQSDTQYGTLYYADGEKLPSAQPEPHWTPCSECMYWRDERVLMNDGKARQYNGDEPDALGIKHSVSIDVGINEGAKCLYEEGRGWSTDHTTFRNADDFCSRAKKRPCSYEEWYGIVDGVYAEPWRGEEHETD